MNKILLTFIFVALLVASCNKSKDCTIEGKWRSIAFTASEAVDLNDDGVYSKKLLMEDPCAEVIYEFLSHGNLKRSSKNKRTNCEWSKGRYNYIIEDNAIHFTVSGMKQSHDYKIDNCQLKINGILGSGITEAGRKSFLINVVLEQE